MNTSLNIVKEACMKKFIAVCLVAGMLSIAQGANAQSAEASINPAATGQGI